MNLKTIFEFTEVKANCDISSINNEITQKPFANTNMKKERGKKRKKKGQLILRERRNVG